MAWNRPENSSQSLMRLLMTFATVTSGGASCGGGALPQPSSANRLNRERSIVVRVIGAFIVLGSQIRQQRPRGVTVPPELGKETIPGGRVLAPRALFCHFRQPSHRPVDPRARGLY